MNHRFLSYFQGNFDWKVRSFFCVFTATEKNVLKQASDWM